jgi:hypothetical protein
MTGALAAALPSTSLPRGPVSADDVRGLAADLAAELLHQMVESASAPGDDAQGHAWSASFDCKGTTFGCSGYYSCPGLGAHSCSGAFSCGTTFQCTQVFAGFRGIPAIRR